MLLEDLESHQLGKPLSHVSFWMVDWRDSPEADKIQREVANDYKRLDKQQFPRGLTLAHYANGGE
jgi:hypothetical protein